MSQLIPMDYEGQEVRTVTRNNGDTLWVAKDVAIVLGYKEPLRAIKQHCKGGAIHTPLKTAGGTQEVRVIHEPDLYRLIANSKLPSAEKFERWIFEEVLPSIRKTGSYQAPIQKPASLLPIDREFRAAVRMAKAAGLKGNQAVLSANSLTIQMTGTDCLQLLGATHLPTEDQEKIFTATELAEMLALNSAQAVNKLLKEKGYQDRVGKSWIPTDTGKAFAVLLDTGKKHKSTGAMVQQVKWKESVVSVLTGEA